MKLSFDGKRRLLGWISHQTECTLKVARVLKRFLPRQEEFHLLFEEDAANLSQAVELFRSLVRSQDLEEKGTKAK